ncbi:MAG: hypothetical protein HC902_00325 [Calothrix sp. SM1_5_4]|nr:hypothetical protein [Calothrix sp. SM1_5_4]
MSDAQINIQNIDCPSLRARAKAAIEDLAELCPSDASIRATFKKIGGRFMAEVRVASETAYMQAVDSSAALNDVIDHIRANLMGQIIELAQSPLCVLRFASFKPLSISFKMAATSKPRLSPLI